LARARNILLFCSYCNKETKMARVGEMTAEENGTGESSGTVRVWYRCSRCHHNALVDETNLYASKEADEGKSLSKDQCMSYSPDKSYSIGDAIYHTEWDDIGLVRNREKSSDGSYAILVEFQRLGQRKLIDSLRSPEE
jgi:hypothetical protein